VAAVRLIPESWHARLIAGAVAWGLALTALSAYQARRDGPPPENRPIREPDGGFVTADTCRSCHPGNHASWHASFHRTMTQVAKPENLQTNADGLELEHAGITWRLERRGDAYYARQRSPGGDGFGAPREVVLLTGSHTLQILWLETGEGRTLVQFPFAYIIAEKLWAPVTQTFLLPPEYRDFYAVGEWNGACMDCHVTDARSRFVAGDRFDSKVADFGISCEACHGEGATHIARNRSPLRRFALHLGGGADDTIVNPARLPAAESTLACGQCHSVWAFNSQADKLAWNQQGGTYRAGGKDLAERFVVQPGDTSHAAQKEQLLRVNPHFFGDRFWPDGMIRVTGREYNGTVASPCFKGGEFSCLSCHEMHPAQPATRQAIAAWADDQLKPGMRGDRACVQCHEPIARNLTAHTHHAADSAGSSCMNCHLPHTTYGLLRAMRSHQVSSPTLRESLEHGRPNACNLCHLDRTLAWTGEKLHEWYAQPPVPAALPADEREIAAGVLWLLKGDAGQRALTAWSMGWAPAQVASGRDWLYPYLITGLGDPYAASRFVAWKSLQTLPGFDGFAFPYAREEAAREAGARAAYAKWWDGVRRDGAVHPPAVILDSTGRLRADIFQRLLRQRNQREVFLAE